jgi:hypothetical protein
MSSATQRVTDTATGIGHHVTGVVGAVSRRAMSTTGKLVLTGVGAALGALETSRVARDTTRKYADAALQLAAATPLGKVLPSPAYPDEPEIDRAVERVREVETTTPPSQRQAEPTEHQTPSHDADSHDAQSHRAHEAEVHEQAEARAHSEAAREVGAPGAAHEVADEAVAELTDIPAEPDRSELPIADFDSASLASLRGRLRSLSLEDLAILKEYEQAHAHRLPVVTMLDNRIAKLAEGSGSSNGDQAGAGQNGRSSASTA